MVSTALTPAGLTARRVRRRLGAHVIDLKSPALRLRLDPLGAHMLALEAPDKRGRWANLILPPEHSEAQPDPYFRGAFIGRYANRIADGRYPVGEAWVSLPSPPGEHCLHGGPRGFHRRRWRLEAKSDRAAQLSLHLPALDDGFPGALDCELSFKIEGDTLSVDCKAQADAPTVASLSYHPYFKLSGRDIFSHQLRLNSDRYLPLRADQIPTGAVAAVEGAFDLRQPTPLGAHLKPMAPELSPTGGYDHYFLLDRPGPAAELYDPGSGRRLRLYTNQPGLQLYTGGGLGAAGGDVRPFEGLALEPSAYPDAPNQPSFPSAALAPGQTYRWSMRLQLDCP